MPADSILVKALILAYEQLPSYACGGQGEKEGGQGEKEGGEGGREKKSSLMSLL